MLSVIVPVYNVESYLPKCLNSLLEQGLEHGDYEVILIDDGSTDASFQCCQEYEAAFPGVFRAVAKKNGGVSSARNLGIDMAKGEFVYFIDPDDYLEPGALRRMMDAHMTPETDVLHFQAIEYSGEMRKWDGSSHVVYNENAATCPPRYLNQNAWNLIVRTDFLCKHEIRFEPNMVIAEDVLFNIELIANNCRLKIISDRVYHYVLREESAVRDKTKDKLLRHMYSLVTLVEKN